MIAAAADVRELGIELHGEDESAGSAVFRELKLDREKPPTEPLFHGKWE